MLRHEISSPPVRLLLSVLVLKDAGRNHYAIPGVDHVVSHESGHFADDGYKALIHQARCLARVGQNLAMVVPGHQKSRDYHATLDSFVIYGHCQSSMLTGGSGHRRSLVQRSWAGPPAPLWKVGSSWTGSSLSHRGGWSLMTRLSKILRRVCAAKCSVPRTRATTRLALFITG